MRDKICKAKRKDNREWIEGYYFCMAHNDSRHIHHFIIPIGVDLSLGTTIEKIQVEIDVDTLCDDTGLTDKNGKKIWENDVCNCVYDARLAVRAIVWDESELDFKGTNGKENYKTEFDYLDCCEEIEVIGNIFDNPELLKDVPEAEIERG